MYNPPHFRDEDRAALHAMIGATPFCLLVSAGADGVPEATHLPMLLTADEGEHGTLYGHVARANPHWQALAAAPRARVVFSGPDAYVSPSFYATKKEHGRVVPTWNYVAVHAIGTVELFDDPARLRDIVTRLTDRFEAPRAAPWAVTDAPEDFLRAHLKGIVGIRLPIEALIGKRKLSQNRSEADRAGVIAGLSASEDAAERAVAEAMGAA